MYTLGNGVEQDYAQALHWFAKAANQGSAEALYGLLQLPPPYQYSRKAPSFRSGI
ncbi:SEL1-like repeat protein [Thiothrix litoralis]|uniref:SEL1-like repeat protein n=2 Tax=Thiothrix litoralis TaxID=2891210 RepID=A0ABX7WNF2_9GAMM|nr:SEL1-like repeat protein [Thiothrix litoralis]